MTSAKQSRHGSTRTEHQTYHIANNFLGNLSALLKESESHFSVHLIGQQQCSKPQRAAWPARATGGC